ncbi:FAD-dependent oxidoreductase [Alkalihalobacillus sp. CinArs1]|uniref:FAD-dependent oxidoreductase n=1 Tax=Alkalihalobacillus sp. CinArs1 TaxID=2995314 RepID=UPI0022DDCD96|nr:FAD-dependent oxidoreductase [Alkalihalobacillus sp. CinArs1]
MKKKLLLIGGGHAHLYVIKKLQEEAIDAEVSVISPSEHQYYSGMFSGFMEGLYEFEKIRIHIPTLAKKANVTFIKGAALSIDAEAKVVLTEKGDIVPYDVLSIDIGSYTGGIDVPGVRQHALRIKPTYRIEEVVSKLWDADEPVVVGGGAAGIEMALSLHAKRRSEDAPVTLVTQSTLLAGETEKATSKIQEIAKEKGLRVYEHEKVSNVTSSHVITAGGKQIAYDELLWLTGPKAPGIFQTSKLPVDPQGYLLVEDTLQVREYPAIFAAGDCASIKGFPKLPKSGVIAVRQSKVLWDNIKSFIKGEDGTRFQPKQSYLSILSTGNREGLLLYSNLSFHHHLSWKLKNKIDRKFVETYK